MATKAENIETAIETIATAIAAQGACDSEYLQKMCNVLKCLQEAKQTQEPPFELVTQGLP